MKGDCTSTGSVYHFVAPKVAPRNDSPHRKVAPRNDSEQGVNRDLRKGLASQD